MEIVLRFSSFFQAAELEYRSWKSFINTCLSFII